MTRVPSSQRVGHRGHRKARVSTTKYKDGLHPMRIIFVRRVTFRPRYVYRVRRVYAFHNPSVEPWTYSASFLGVVR